MGKRILVGLVVLASVGCARVSVQIQDEQESRHFTVPFSVVKMAFKMSTDGELEIDDLGGFSDDFDLRALALGFREHGDKMKLEATQGDAFYRASAVGNVFQVHIEEPEEDRVVMINLPMQVLDAFTEENEGKVDPDLLIKGLKKFKGTLIKVTEPGETIRIVMK